MKEGPHAAQRVRPAEADLKGYVFASTGKSLVHGDILVASVKTIQCHSFLSSPEGSWDQHVH